MSIKEYYKQRGVDIIQDTGQEYNDLDKALSAIRDWKMQKMTMTPEETETRQGRHDPNQTLPCGGNKEEGDLQIFVYGAFGGRFDQEMASIQALYRWKDVFQYRIALYTDETFAILTRPQVTNEIYLPFHSKMEDHVDKGQEISHGEGPTCGLIPIGCRCDGVKTNGFKWNLDGSVPLEFGGLISTSNRAEDFVLQIESPQPLVFTAEIVVISK
jgi:Thiamine pyrophosphokinase